jgi:putative ABC transport system permease protein
MRVPTPLRLLRFPGLLVAITVAAAVLGVVGAATEPFLDAAGTETLRRYRAEEVGPIPSVAITTNSAVAEDVVTFRTQLLSREIGTVVHDPIVTARGDPVDAVAGEETEPVRILTRTGFLDHVEVIDRTSGEGVWVSDYTAANLGVGPGDDIILDGRAGSTTTRIAGVYRDLLTLPPTPFWRGLDDFIYTAPGADVRPPALLLMDLATYFDLDSRLLDDIDVFIWEFTFRPEQLTLPEARALVRRLERFHTTLLDASSELGAAFVRGNYNEPLSGWVTRAEAVVASIRGPIESIAVAGQVVALVVVAAAGLFAVRRRRVEYTVLHARGVSPLRLGARAAVEAIVPVALGSAAGLALGWLLVRTSGPGDLVGPEAVRAAVRTVAWSAVLALVMLGSAAGLSVRSQAEEGTHRLRKIATRVPWELLVLAIAAAAWYEISTRGIASTTGDDGQPGVDRLLLLFPILFVGGVAGLVARGLRWGLPRLRAVGRGWPHSLYLAIRRVSAAPRLATSLVVGAAVATGMLVYASTLSSSIGATANQEASLRVGSDTKASFTGPAPDLSEAPAPSTAVTRVFGAGFALGSEDEVDVLAIDPASFPEVAFWEDEFAGDSLAALVDRVADPPERGRLPVLLGGSAFVPDDPVLRIGSSDIPVTVVGRTSSFPGMVGRRAVIVADAATLDEVLTGVGEPLARYVDAREVWTTGSEADLVSYLRRSGNSVLRSITAQELRSTPEFLSLTWMLGFMQALGLLTGLVTLVGAQLYLLTRQRDGLVSYALSRRMGLRPGEHRRSVAIEVGATLALSFLVGAGLAMLASRLTFDRIEVSTEAGTVPLFRLPFVVLTVALSTLLLFAWCGSWLVQRRADHADVSEVLRLAD